MTETEQIRLPFPRKLAFLLIRKRWRFKVAHGGRGSAKSWSFARALLVLGCAEPLRILCAREIQKSLKESVHQLLKDQIELMGLSDQYEILETEIRGKNGTLFMFAGLQAHTVTSIKSYEGVDIVGGEEAQTVSKRSWTILEPTIRKDHSEIWVSLNPELDSDETFVRFVANPPADGSAMVAAVNYTDNPWFPEVSEKTRLLDKGRMTPDEYANVWKGHCRATVAGAIYAMEVGTALSEGRITFVPYDPKLKVHVVFDLGWNDSMFLILVQRHFSSLRIIEAIQVDHKTLDWCSGELRLRRHNWGKLYLPHDGAHGDFKTGKSSKQIMKEKGWAVVIVPKQPIETGIRAGREAFSMAVFDKVKAEPLISALKRYKRHLDSKTEEAGTPVHDDASHGADCWRYLATAAPYMTNEEPPPIPKSQIVDYGVNREMGM